jgi:hypothetical protein
VPFCTDVREGYLRVRYCSQARAIENQCYVVLSGNVGNLPGVNNFDIQYGRAASSRRATFRSRATASPPTPHRTSRPCCSPTAPGKPRPRAQRRRGDRI